MRQLTAALLLLILLSILTPVLDTDASTCIRVDVPAVESQGGRGSVVGITICIAPGNSSLRIYGVDKVERDTLISIIAAYSIAQILSNRSPTSYVIDVNFEKYVQDVAGPSAGALLTLAFYELLSGRNGSLGFSGTGAINLDGSIEAVGGVAQKLSALRASGYREVFLPVANYAWYGSSFRDLRISPAGSVAELLNISLPESSLGVDYARGFEVISRVSRDHAALMKGLLDSLSRIYMSRVSDTGSQEYRIAVSLLSAADRNPPEDGYALINLYFLSTVYLAQVIVDRDLNGYGKTLIKMAAEEYNRSVGRLASAFSNIPRSVSVDRLLLYLLIFERALNLTGYDSQVREYLDSGDAGSIARVAGALYGRALSIGYWLDVLGNMTRGGVAVDLEKAYRVSKNLLALLGVYNISEESVVSISRAIGSKADLEGLGMLNTIYTLYSYLQDYSFRVRSSTFSQAILTDPRILDQLRGSDYMKSSASIIESGVARSIYSFSLWAFNNMDLQSQGVGILMGSMVSTSASASSLNMIYLILSKKIDIPLSLELSESSRKIFQDPAGGGSAPNTTYIDLEELSDILALASIAISIATMIYMGLARRGSKG